MVLTPPMVVTQTDGIVSVLLDHIRTRGPSVARIQDFPNSNSNYVFLVRATIKKANVFCKHHIQSLSIES